jgi:hypothetical protein
MAREHRGSAATHKAGDRSSYAHTVELDADVDEMGELPLASLG